MAIEFDGKGNIVGTTPDGVIAVKFYSLEKQIAELKSQLQQKENKEKEIREYIRSNEWGIDYEHSSCRTRLLEILDKDITKKSDCNYEKIEKENK